MNTTWNKLYGLSDFPETMDKGGIYVQMIMQDNPETPLWIAVASCIVSNYSDAMGGTYAPESKAKAEFNPPWNYNREFVEYANIRVTDFGDKLHVLNNLTGENYNV